ncbi:MAG: hypothetical protein JWO32_2786 [Bacteroidetes bacterium]|nr:hypothetical protein [Bacteroidota bacterium]
MAPSCKKSNMMPKGVSDATETQQKQGPSPQPVPDNTSMYVMLASKPCSNPQKEYTSLTVDIRGVKVYSPENGWVTLPMVAGWWDLVSMQQGNSAGLNITNRIAVRPGGITKVAVSFGVNNKLVVNNDAASCFKLGTQEVVFDMKGEVQKNAVNELLIAMDICGNISVETNNDGNKCYLLKPVVQFERVSQKMIK